MKIAKEFKEFITKGNVMDMAIGVIIGGAFGKIVTSLVDNVLMPLIGLVTGGIDVSDWKWVITPASTAADGAEIAESALRYGLFIQTVIDFLIIALCIFLMVKVINAVKERAVKKKEEEKKEEEPKKSDEVVLLEEIRDLLKK